MTDCIVLDYRRSPDGDVCVQRGVHGGDCPGDACDGCLPTPAAAGRICCERHEDAVRTGLQAFADLWRDIGDAGTRAPGSDARSEAEQDATPQPLPVDVAVRSQIKATLVGWCKVLEDDFGVPLPSEDQIDIDAAETIQRREWDLNAVVQAWRAAAATDRARLNDAARTQRKALADLRDDLGAGVHVIRALAGHVDDHRPKLLADYPAGDGFPPCPTGVACFGCRLCGQAREVWERQHADRGRIFAEDILDVHARARRLVDRSRVGVRIRCSCGGHVTLDAEPLRADGQPRKYACNGCGEQCTQDDWIRREAPAMTSQPMPLSDLPDWLLRHHRVTVTLEQLRGWSRGERAAITALPPEPGEPGGRTRRRMYDPVAVLTVARSKAERGRRSA